MDPPHLGCAHPTSPQLGSLAAFPFLRQPTGLASLHRGASLCCHTQPRQQQPSLALTLAPTEPLFPGAGVLCGAAASGAFTWTPENVAKSVLCMVMSGPLLTGYTQVRSSRLQASMHAAAGASAGSRLKAQAVGLGGSGKAVGV